MAASNRAVTFLGPHKMEVQDKGYPKLQDPKGRKIEHAVILKIITTNICGSDLHIYNGRFAAPKGMQMGHENTGEVVEVGLACRAHQGRRYLLRALQRGLRHMPKLQGTPHRCVPER